MQPVVAIFVGLACTLLLARFRLPMALAFVIGAAVLGLVAGLGPVETAATLGRLAIDPGTWAFAGLVGLVEWLCVLLTLSGSFDVLVDASGALIRSRRLRLASLPALVGLLPMPGGAQVSAPLVDRTRCDRVIGAPEKNLINYWFRHVWEVCWPLYPGILLAADFAHRSVGLISGLQLPLFFVMVVVGWSFILRRVPGGPDSCTTGIPPARALARAILPLVLVVSGMQLFTWLVAQAVPGLPPARAGQTGLAVSLAAGIAAAALLDRNPRNLARSVRDKATWGVFLLALGVKVFGSMVEVSGAAGAAATTFQRGGVPELVAVVVLPLLVGFATGNTVATVSVSFPVLVALLTHGEAGASSLLAPLVLAYASGFLGYMLSPVHMCLVLSSRYFGQSVADAWPRLVVPLLAFAAGSAALFLALSAFVP